MSDPAAAFDALVRDYYQAWFRFHPEQAVDVGVPGYAHLLTPYGEQAIGALVCLNDELRAGLEELDVGALDADRRLDCALLAGAVQLENQRLIELESRRPDPEALLPVHAIYQLTIRPVEDFEDALQARLAAIPAHLAGARDYLLARAEHLPPLWVRSAVAAARAGSEFLRALPSHPKLASRAALETSLAAAAAAGTALCDYATFLESVLLPRARGEFACGVAYFNNLLRYRHGLDVGADVLHERGEELLARTRAELEEACLDLAGSRDIAAILARIRAEHPAAPELLEVYRRQMRAARAFLAERDLVSLPANETLEVVETPLFLRHQVPFAAYCEPAPNDPAQHGYYYVTPPEDAAQLAEHHIAGIMNTCVHEAWPGHHLQFVTAHLHPAARTLPRLLNASATFYEGWALYSEQLMYEQGFLDRPEHRFILLRDRLWRALRILLDVEIHTRGLSLEAAAERMVRELGFPRAQAIADLTWYTRAPTVPLGYAIGWMLINAARRRALAEGMSLKAFHDRLLSAGSIGLPLVIRRVFGEAMWEAVKAEVFGGDNIERNNP